MHNLRIKSEKPKDAATRKQAVRLALSGHRLNGHEYADLRKPYCDEPVTIHREIKAGGLHKGLSVTTLRPCRKCSKCLQFRQMRWRERANRELAMAPRTWFLTLTFSPVHLAGILLEARKYKLPSDVKRVDRAAYAHVQLFLKRLRKASGAKCRFLAVFERGEELGRPHYHLLLHEVDKPITKAMIQSQWRSHTHCRLVALGDRGTSTYITKYATKSFDIAPRASINYGKLLLSSS